MKQNLDKGRGPVATLLVQNGTLRVGDRTCSWKHLWRVRAMVNDLGQRVKEAGPSTPVEITGLNEVPQAGDQFLVFTNEKLARQIGEARQAKIHPLKIDKNNIKLVLDDLFEQIKQGEMKEINIIIKADVQGTVEALPRLLKKLKWKALKLKLFIWGWCDYRI